MKTQTSPPIIFCFDDSRRSHLAKQDLPFRQIIPDAPPLYRAFASSQNSRNFTVSQPLFAQPREFPLFFIFRQWLHLVMVLQIVPAALAFFAAKYSLVRPNGLINQYSTSAAMNRCDQLLLQFHQFFRVKPSRSVKTNHIVALSTAVRLVYMFGVE